jgi:hypothetical protein
MLFIAEFPSDGTGLSGVSSRLLSPLTGGVRIEDDLRAVSTPQG